MTDLFVHQEDVKAGVEIGAAVGGEKQIMMDEPSIHPSIHPSIDTADVVSMSTKAGGANAGQADGDSHLPVPRVSPSQEAEDMSFSSAKQQDAQRVVDPVAGVLPSGGAAAMGVSFAKPEEAQRVVDSVAGGSTCKGSEAMSLLCAKQQESQRLVNVVAYGTMSPHLADAKHHPGRKTPAAVEMTSKDSGTTAAIKMFLRQFLFRVLFFVVVTATAGVGLRVLFLASAGEGASSWTAFFRPLGAGAGGADGASGASSFVQARRLGDPELSQWDMWAKDDMKVACAYVELMGSGATPNDVKKEADCKRCYQIDLDNRIAARGSMLNQPNEPLRDQCIGGECVLILEHKYAMGPNGPWYDRCVYFSKEQEDEMVIQVTQKRAEENKQSTTTTAPSNIF
ncbi:unnamed protein product [Amoebophrya sp. A120]|nr:unnamed protein product [Amoebophrya sp. A120]|eukprot:GSA120T00016010001.1